MLEFGTNCLENFSGTIISFLRIFIMIEGPDSKSQVFLRIIDELPEPKTSTTDLQSPPVSF